MKVFKKGTRLQTWDVFCEKNGQKTFIKNLANKGAIIISKEDGNFTTILVESNRAMQIEKMLKEREINFDLGETILMEGAEEKTTAKNIAKPINAGYATFSRYTSSPRVVMRPKPVLDWKNFYSLDAIYSFLYSLEAEFPAKCTIHAIGKSVEGRDIKMLKISNSNASNTGVWMDGAIHAREWTSTAVVTFIANHIAKNFDHLPGFITDKDWYIVPVANPDGYVYSHTTDRMWRKNRARQDNTIVGVDLNRNFGTVGFDQSHGEGMSQDPSHLNYRGPEPFSEPETAAIKDVILYSGTPFKMFLTFHAFSEVVAFPWCCNSEPCPDYVNLLEGATVMSKAIHEVNGRMYKVGAFKDLMYSACGTSIDWSYGVAHVPFSYLVELRSKKSRFILPKDEIIDCCKEVLNGVLSLSEYVDKKRCNNCVVLNKRRRI